MNIDDIINIKPKYSNSGKLCKVPGCFIQCSYNFPGKFKEYCDTHKLDGMVDVTNPICVVCCQKRAYFNTPGKIPEYCTECKTLESVNVTHFRYRKCVECLKYGSYISPQNFRYCHIHKGNDCEHIRKIKKPHFGNRNKIRLSSLVSHIDMVSNNSHNDEPFNVLNWKSLPNLKRLFS